MPNYVPDFGGEFDRAFTLNLIFFCVVVILGCVCLMLYWYFKDGAALGKRVNHSRVHQLRQGQALLGIFSQLPCYFYKPSQTKPYQKEAGL